MAIASKFVIKNGIVTFVGMVKRKLSNTPDPVQDRVLSNSPDIEDQKEIDTEGFVTLRIPSDPSDPRGGEPIDINLNGRNYVLPRDKVATIPKEIAEILLNAESSKSIAPLCKNERIVCQVDPGTGTYIEGSKPQEVETRRFKVEIEEVS